MGMFDYVKCTVTCPNCKSKQELDFQTQDTRMQMMYMFEEGDITCEPEDFYFDGCRNEEWDKDVHHSYEIIEPSTLDCRCENCGKLLEIIGICRHDRLLKVVEVESFFKNIE